MSFSKSVVRLNPVATFPEGADRAERLQRRVDREHAARHEAERLLERKSLELFDANQRLIELNAQLEQRVDARTRQAEDARREAVRIGTTDHLTGIANRLRYIQQLERSLRRVSGGRGAAGLLLVDLDGFKLINDTYGHRHGDQLLIVISRRLEVLSGPNDFVARIGGDEFAIVIEGDDAMAIASAARRFRSVFEQAITIHGVTVQASGSFGLAISPDDCTNASDLQRFADLALYKSKQEGKGELALFEPADLQDYEYRQRLEGEFRTALDGGMIDLAYQPIICLQSDRIQAVEALARWTDSAGVPISPGYFIPMAEQCGIIRGVGRNLLEKALLETGAWLRSGALGRLSFNVSPLELLDDGFSETVLSILNKYNVDPVRLLLEITEGAVLPNVELVDRIIGKLRAHGVMFALDDFGRGYSDMSVLRRLPISIIKIDQSLLVDAETDRSARVILCNVIALCRDLGVRSICEGAETQSQVALLRAIGCDSVQGFAMGRPASPDVLRQLLERNDAERRVGPRSRTAAAH
ncbi:MAG: EAL domain-containing protein [Sphingomonas sp.]|nr:EAL domain-containing protein [Sphingomonas sp.]